MPNEKPTTVREHFSLRFRAFVFFLIDFGFDVVVGAAIFGAFLLFAWIFSLARAAGFAKTEHLDAFELLHFWLNYALYLSIGAALLFRTIKRIFREE
ncbi:MAG TPA: hypothetical protein VNY05_37785 [Candidatus Acidoferrales bacterium]|jgi:hypothetical protein|nr:hypothetical protein [Candidatus Acidoferrales bacterium]